MKWLVMFALVLLMAWLEGVAVGSEEAYRREEQATRMTSLVVHCLNQGAIQQGEYIVDCVRRKK